MKIIVEMANSANEYMQQWTKAMVDAHWFHNPSLFYYNREEMAEEIVREFHKPECIHLLAKSADSNEILGCLKIKINGYAGILGRWEPAVPVRHRKSGVGEALIEESFAILREHQLSRARCILKFPYNQPETARYHLRLYQKCGFVKERPNSILLLTNISKATTKPHAIKNLYIVDDADFSLEEYADFTQRAYISTPEDKAVHQHDQYISNRKNVLNVLAAIKTGKLGFSPRECWQIARLGNDIAGFIIGFILKKTKYQPALGIIAELGIFPEFRRKGIALSLIANIFECFRRHECNYSLVGTPKANKPALRLYSKAGYIPTFEQIDFQKIL